MDGQLGRRVLLMLADKARTLDEHTAGTAGRIENASVVSGYQGAVDHTGQ